MRLTRQSLKMVDWLLVDQIISVLGFYLTTTSQFTLIFLTLFFVKRDFGSYKYLILTFSIVGIMFASCEYILYPVLHFYNCGYMYFSFTRPLGVSNEIVKIIMVTYTGFYSSTISLLAVQFLYRYVAVFKEKSLVYFGGIYFFIWILYVAWFGIEWAMGLYIFAQLDDYSRRYMGEEMEQFYGYDIDTLPVLSVTVYESTPNSTEWKVRWWNLLCTFNMTFIMCFQYGVMIVCGTKLYNDMNEKISILSKQLRNLHKQIFKTLLLQITTPTVVLFSPIVFVIYAPLFDLKISVPTGVFLCGFTLYPALDAFILMYVITDYRRAFQNLVSSGRSKNQSSTQQPQN